MAKKKAKKVEKPEAQTNDTDVMFKLLDEKIEVPLGLLRQKHIFIATPCYGGQLGEPYFRSMMRLAILFNKYNIQYLSDTCVGAWALSRSCEELLTQLPSLGRVSDTTEK